MAWAHLPVFIAKMDFVAANVFRALGARPIRDVSVRARGRLGHLAFGIDSIARLESRLWLLTG